MAVISIAGITITQVYWLRKAFDIRENQFNRDVKTALNNVALKIFEINQTPIPSSPVEQVATNYFIVHANGPVNASVLEFLLVTEFKARNITTGFEYGIYDCVEKCMIGGNYISPKNVKTVSQFPETPMGSSDGYYFAVQFPYLEANLLSQMGIWGFSSIVTLVVIMFFGYTLFVILRQRRLSEVQRDFINNMTHEFKTPISTIAISAQVLKDPAVGLSPDRLHNYATIIENENHRLRQQVERVLQIAELDKQDFELKMEPLALNGLVQEAVDARSLGLAAKIVLEGSAASDLVLGDRLHLSNAIGNLLDNAVKYSDDHPVVTVRAFNPNWKQVQISVKDQGIGIAGSDQKRIFDKFYRVPTGNRHNVKGFGLGLSYVKKIVQRHKGEVRVESKPGEGSTFHIVLPLYNTA